MLKVSVTSAPVEVINYTDKKTGQPAQLRKQTAYLHTFSEDGSASAFPDKFGFLLGREQAPFPAGEYTLHPSAIVVDREGRLSCLPRLTPAQKPAKS